MSSKKEKEKKNEANESRRLWIHSSVAGSGGADTRVVQPQTGFDPDCSAASWASVCDHFAAEDTLVFSVDVGAATKRWQKIYRGTKDIVQPL